MKASQTINLTSGIGQVCKTGKLGNPVVPGNGGSKIKDAGRRGQISALVICTLAFVDSITGRAAR
jgi:hypothetical protein